jgi:hypothetical protein
VAIPAHLTIPIEGLRFDALLSDWRWLVGTNYTPILITAFGDLFLRDDEGRVHFLDLMAGQFKQVAESEQQFNDLCEDRGQRRTWFLGSFLTEIRKILGELATGECYRCKVPLSIGGELSPENFERTDLQTHYSVLGQLHRQTRNLPPGTKINRIKIGE